MRFGKFATIQHIDVGKVISAFAESEFLHNSTVSDSASMTIAIIAN